MKRSALLLFGLCVCLLAGCPAPVEDRPGVEVVIDGGLQFPAELAGVWKAESGGWEIVLEPNGTISSAIVGLSRVRMKPGQATRVPMKMGGKGVFEAGPWVVHYSHDRRQLTVEIAIANLRVELGKDDVLSGRRLDLFTGTISPDGKSWWASRFSFPEYVADTKKYRNHQLTVDPNDTPPEEFLFRKVSTAEHDAPVGKRG